MWRSQETGIPENKADLAKFLTKRILQNADTLKAEIFTAAGSTEIKEVASSNERDIQCLKASHEKADTLLSLHA